MNDVATGRIGGSAADTAARPHYSTVDEALDAADAAQARGEAAVALSILAELSRDCPDHPVPLLRAAAMLSQQRRFDEAEALLADGAARFPNEIGFAVERGWTAQRRGNLDEADARFAELRERLPGHPVGFIGGAAVRRDRGDFDGADVLLHEAIGRFPNEPAPVIDFAWVAQIKRDWAEAASRWQRVRESHGDYAVGYVAGATALRELDRLNHAAALLDDARSRFPNEAGPIIESAWLAHHRRDWPAAVARWQCVRERCPQLSEGYLRGAQALAAMSQHEAAEHLLAEAMAGFPQDAMLAAEHAWSAFHRHELETAAQRFAALRARFPETPAGYTGGADALRDLGRIEEAEALLDAAQRRFPENPKLAQHLFEARQRLAELAGSSEPGSGLFRPRLRDAHHLRRFDDDVRALLKERALDRLYWPHRARTVVAAHAELYNEAARAIGPDAAVTVLEFGVAHGRSMQMLAERFGSADAQFFGFDSFVGLPEAWLMHAAGAFSRDGKAPPIDDARVSFIPGWFQNTVPAFLADFTADPARKYLIHFDADLYSSTLFLLTSLWHQLPQYHFLMDDFAQEDVNALYDFASAYPIEIQFLAQTRGGGSPPVPNQVFGRIRRVPFESLELSVPDNSYATSAQAQPRAG